MRITALLFRKNRMPHGHIFMGKDRFVKQVTPAHIRKKIFYLEKEEENMLLLRHPYLTEEQSHGHSKALNKTQKLVSFHTDKYRMRRRDDITIGERMMHLNIQDGWEQY